jgi:hypothetical protein
VSLGRIRREEEGCLVLNFEVEATAFAGGEVGARLALSSEDIFIVVCRLSIWYVNLQFKDLLI